MKKILIAFLFISVNMFAQEFVVEKISGNVKVLRGTSEKFENVKTGERLNGSDLLITEEKSFIQLNKDGNRFILQSNSALGLNYVKEVSINDLLLALAMEEIRRVPKDEGNGNTKNTAVYGEEIKPESSLKISENEMGIKKLNGAKQLAESGYKESAVIVAKETYRKYPSTKNNFEDRVYFAQVLSELKLYSEAYEELDDLKKEVGDSENSKFISEKLDILKSKISN